MIVIGNNLISESIKEEYFVCDLDNCKGRCCEDGDTGAPLTEAELEILKEIYPVIECYLTPMARESIKEQGLYVHDEEFGWVTPSLKKGLCVYGFRNKAGFVKCAIEQAYHEGKIGFKKPVSCHLFPLIHSESEREPGTFFLNYQPRSDLCRTACAQGKRLKVPVYEFLKEPLIRAFGADWYDELKKKL